MASSTGADKNGKVTQRKVYFHIQDKQEVRVKEACREEAAKLPRIRKPDLAYYKTECAYQQVHTIVSQQGSRSNDEGGHHMTPLCSTCLSESEEINENLRIFLAAVSKKPSVDGITFQARFGRMYFVLPRWNDMKIVSTQDLQQNEVIKKFLFRIPFDLQQFIQTSCGSLVNTIDRYKVKFKYYTDEGGLVKATSHIEDKDGTFRHVWTRVKLDGSETKDAWLDETKLVNDIVRPGRYGDIRIVSLPDRPHCTPDDAVYGIAERIAKSMTHTSSGQLSMQVSGEDYCLDFVRKKTMKYHTYKWMHPDGRNQDWTIIECYANNAKDMKLEYLRLRRCKKYDPIIVKFCDQINEIYFKGSTHVTRPKDNPEIKVSTPDQFVSDFHGFVGASFKIADLLEDIYNTSAAH